MHAGHRFELVVLGAEAGGLGDELLGIVGGPPVAQHARAVELAALVVEAVGHLVADHHADAAVVDRRIGGRVEERRLQDGGRKHHLIVGGVVVGVHRLRGHAPFHLVDGLVEPLDLAVPLVALVTLGVPIEVVGADGQLGIIAPLVRIADLDRELAELFLGLLLRLRAHPGQALDPRGQGGVQVGHQGVHLRLGLGGEVLGHIETADRLPEGGVGEAHPPLPARLQLRLAGEGMAAEVEPGLDEPVGQIGRGRVDRVEGLPGFQGVDGGGGIDGGNLGEGGVGAQNHPVNPAKIGGAEHGLEVEARRIGLQLRRSHGVIDLVRIPLLSPSPADLGDLGLEVDDGVGLGGGIRPAGHLQHLGDIDLVGRLLRGELGLDIIVPVGQAHARGVDIDRILGRRLGVRADPDVEDRRLERLDAVAHGAGDVRAGALGADGVQVRGQGRGVQLVDPGLVHEGAIGGAHLDPVGVGKLAGRRVLDDGVSAGLGEHRQGVEIAEPDLVGRDDGALQPFTVGVEEEVGARLHRRVLARGVEAPGSVVRRLQAHRRGGRGRGRGVRRGLGDGARAKGKNGRRSEPNRFFCHEIPPLGEMKFAPPI